MRTIFLSLNTLIAFLSELAMLGAYAWWALSLKLALPLRILIAVVILTVVVVLWGMFFAPKASIVLAQPCWRSAFLRGWLAARTSVSCVRAWVRNCRPYLEVKSEIKIA